MSLPSGASPWNGIFGRVEGQNTTLASVGNQSRISTIPNSSDKKDFRKKNPDSKFAARIPDAVRRSLQHHFAAPVSTTSTKLLLTFTLPLDDTGGVKRETLLFSHNLALAYIL